MSLKLEISNKAKKDLLNILDYYSQIAPIYCEKIYLNIDSSILNLLDYPNLGVEYKNKRILVCGNYLIVYQVFSDKIKIVTIPHAKQNFNK